MKRIPRIRQPSAAFTQRLQSTAAAAAAPHQHAVACRSAAAVTATTTRRREFSTTPHARFQPSIKSYDSPNNSNNTATTTTTAPTTTTTTPSTTSSDHLPPPQAAEEAQAQDPLETIQADDLHAAQVTSVSSIETDLILPPQESTIAPRADELAEVDASTYTPADDATSLEVVGGLGDWFSPKRENWGASKNFVGFGASLKVNNPSLLQACARRAVVEALAVKAQAEGEGAGLLTEAWRREGGREAALKVLSVKIQVDKAGQAVLEGDVEGVVQSLSNDPLAASAATTEGMNITAEEARRMLKSWDASWRNISLEDVKVKFAVTKRLFQLTGHAIPDAKLVHVNTVGQLVDVLVKPAPARTVHKAIEQKGELTKLRNVEVFAKRRTPVHEAKRVGRWKVVEKELEKRGLPVFGHGDVDKSREREWYRGPMPDAKDKKKRR